MKYSTSFRNGILKKVLPPENRSVHAVAKEAGISAITINSWLAKLKDGTLKLEQDEENPSSMRTMREKLDLLLEYQNVPEDNRGEWLRQKGLHTEHLTLLRQELNSAMADKVDEKDRRIQELEKQLKDAKRELDRKNDALAEMAAIYTLKKSWT
ncbi:MAG TPA: helix-turn-helix domain-containing protein [Spirochaetia bacterium]|nr:helix-turn-helix domain-containing protein [Spirochaetia bacterium]